MISKIIILIILIIGLPCLILLSRIEVKLERQTTNLSHELGKFYNFMQNSNAHKLIPDANNTTDGITVTLSPDSQFLSVKDKKGEITTYRWEDNGWDIVK